jgi:hypothetical protein
VGWQSISAQEPHTTTVEAWLKTVVIVMQPGQRTSMKKLLGLCGAQDRGARGRGQRSGSAANVVRTHAAKSMKPQPQSPACGTCGPPARDNRCTAAKQQPDGGGDHVTRH